jgi:hypothetical protein
MTIDEFMTTHRYGYNIVSGKVEQFKYYDLDKSYIELIKNNRFSLVVKSRQMHFTDVMAGYTAWHLLFNTNLDSVDVGYITVNLQSGYHFKERVISYLRKYGFNYKDYLIDNKGKIMLPNGNNLTIFPTNIDAFRGVSFNGLLIIDEAAYIKNFKKIYEVIVSSISENCQLIVGSTPNGIEFFYRLYENSVTGCNIFKSLQVNYKNHPNRNQEWYDDMCVHLTESQIKIELLGEFFIEEKEKKNKKLNQIIFRVEDDIMLKINKKLIDFDIKMSEYIRGLILKDINQ